MGTTKPGAAVVAPPPREVELLAAEIMAAREKSLSDQIGRPSKREIVWFGDVHSCDRHNYYSMAEGDQRTRWNPFVQAKLNAGREWEQITKRELSALGFEPMLAGEVCEVHDEEGRVIARGRTDLSLARATNHRKLYPAEMKQMQPHAWDAVSKWEDLLRSPWTTKYVRQLMLYMHEKGADEGLFILGDFQGHWKIIPVILDKDFVNETLGKIKRAAKAKREGKVPDRIPYDPQLCASCQFAHVCIPDISVLPSEKIEKSELLAELLERRDALYDKAKEYAKIDKKIKAFFEGIKDGVFTVGNFIITRKAGLTTKYEIPDDVKAKYAVKKEQFRNDISRFAQPDPETIFLGPKRLISLDEDE